MSFQSQAPFADFTHCPRCGIAALTQHSKRAISCKLCGFIYFFNSATAVAALLSFKGKLLLGVRGEEPQKGMLDLPGGFVEYDESAEDALTREIMEELNLRIKEPVYLSSAPNDYCYAGVYYKTTDLFFTCELEDISTIKAGDDLDGYKLIPPNELDPRQLAFKSGRLALRKLLDRLNSITM